MTIVICVPSIVLIAHTDSEVNQILAIIAAGSAVGWYIYHIIGSINLKRADIVMHGDTFDSYRDETSRDDPMSHGGLIDIHRGTVSISIYWTYTTLAQTGIKNPSQPSRKTWLDSFISYFYTPRTLNTDEEILKYERNLSQFVQDNEKILNPERRETEKYKNESIFLQAAEIATQFQIDSCSNSSHSDYFADSSI